MMQTHPETWHIISEAESNWEQGDPFAVYLTGNEGQQICVLFIIPILSDLYHPTFRHVEEDVNDFMDMIKEDISNPIVEVYALNYYLIHELVHWGV